MHRRVFTEEEKQFILNNWNKLSIHKIRDIINCSNKAIEYFAQENNLELPKSNRWTEEEIETLRRLSLTMQAKDIAKKLNKTENAIYQKGKKIGIDFECDRRIWKKEEELELRRLWGTIPIERISKRLNRSIYSLKVKANRLSLGPMYGNNPEFLTIKDITNLLKVTREKVENSWSKLGLNIRQKKLTNKCSYYCVTWEDLLTFLENNQDEWDSRKLEINIFGEEPNWLIEKRKRDIKEDPQGYKRWTKEEIDLVEHLFNQGKNYKEIALILKRSESAIANILRNLGYSYRLPQFWKGKELLFLKENYKNMTFEEIGEIIGRSERAVEMKAKQLGYNKIKR